MLGRSCIFDLNYRALLHITSTMIVVLLTLPSNCWSKDDLVTLYDELSAGDIDHKIYYYADSQGSQSISEMIANRNLFVPLVEKRFTFNIHTHWYKIDIANPYDVEKRWLLSAGIATAPLFKAYWLENGDVRELPIINDQTKGSERKFSYSSIVIPLDFAPQQSGTIFIQYRSLANFPLTIAPFSSEELLSRNLKYALLNGICLGATAIFWLLYLLQLFIRPTKVLFYYVLYIGTILVFMIQIFGYGMQFLWPDFGEFNSYFTFIVSALIYVFYFAFTSSLFQLKRNNIVLYRILLMASISLCLVIFFEAFADLDYLLSLIIVLSLPMPVVCAVWAIRHRNPSAMFFLFGSTIHCLATYLLIITCLGIDIGFNVFGISSAGQLIDIACFSAAIFYQSNKTREELHSQIEERKSDMELLALSEQEQEHAIDISKKATLDLATTAHDLVQPLSSIRLGLSAMKNTNPNAGPLLNTAHYANDLLHSVLQSSKKEYLNLPQDAMVSDIIEEVARRYERVFAEKRLEFKTHIHDARLRCSPILVKRVIDNLLANAYKHTKSGGVLLSGRKRQDSYLIQVWDTGVGMDRQQVEVLKLPFKQLRENEAAASGMGLGLFIVKTLCDQAHMGFDIRTKRGKGTCISLTVKQAS